MKNVSVTGYFIAAIMVLFGYPAIRIYFWVHKVAHYIFTGKFPYENGK